MLAPARLSPSLSGKSREKTGFEGRRRREGGKGQPDERRTAAPGDDEDHSRLGRARKRSGRRVQAELANLLEEAKGKTENSLVSLRDEVGVGLLRSNRSVDLFLRSHDIDRKSSSLSLLEVDRGSLSD